MDKSKLSPKIKKQVKEDSALLCAMLDDIIELFRVASDIDFMAKSFGMTKKDFLYLWHNVIILREKVEVAKSVPKTTPEKDVTE